jgi:hypothetical protein
MALGRYVNSQWTKLAFLNSTIRVADTARNNLDQNLSFLRIFDVNFFDDQFRADIWNDGCLARLWIIAHSCALFSAFVMIGLVVVIRYGKGLVQMIAILRLEVSSMAIFKYFERSRTRVEMNCLISNRRTWF